MSLDRATRDKLKRGLYPIDMRVDLHGLTRLEAHDAVENALKAAAAQGMRCLLVIPGKSGILRTLLPQWLEMPDVLETLPAQPQHGGQGACYVLLRRRRARHA